MIVLIPYLNILNLSWIKMSIFEEYGAFKIYKQITTVIKWSVSRSMDIPKSLDNT